MSERVPEGWRETSIGELTKANSLFCDGDWVESKDQDPNGSNRLIQLADIGDGRFINKSARFLNDEQFERLKCTPLKKGDILVARMPEPLGRACLYPINSGRAATIVDIAIIRTPNADHQWLVSAINSADFRASIDLNASGTTRTRIARGALAKLKIIAPPLPEQQKIAKILTSVDEVIEKTQAQIDKLKDLKTGMMQELLTNGVGVDGKPHTEFKDSPIGRIPKCWGVKPLESVVERIVDCEHKTAPYVDKSDYLVIRTSNVRNGSLVFNDMKYTHADGYNDWTKRAVPTVGDVLFTREAPAGESCLVPERLKVCMGQRMVLLRPNKKSIIPSFFSSYLTSETASKLIYDLSIGTTVTRINIEDIRRIPCVVPPLEEQHQISEALSSVQQLLDKKSEKLFSLQNTKKALMQDLLTGKVRVTID
ncbi:restriction endonuclease subunit S [Shewanella xiamenensis]|uniref:restriction endonuclease subunit S n=1 Tax=Shewanella xiamenensis TaxID=332186 RepID=UPI00313C9E8C